MPQIVLNPTGNAMLKEINPNYNYDTPWALECGKEDNKRKRGAIRFNIPANPGFPGTITQVRLRFFSHASTGKSPTTGTPTALYVYLFDSDINTGLITWASQPTASLPMGNKGWPVSGGVYHDIDITTNFPGWGVPCPLRIHLDNEASYNNWWVEISAINNPWGNTRPQLIIDYIDDAPSPSVLTIQPQTADKEKVLLSWTQMPEPDFKEYNIFKRIPGDTWTLETTITTQTITTWNDPASLTDGQTYEYYIESVDINDQVANSNIVSMTKPQVTSFIVSDQTPLVGQAVQGTITAQGGTINLYYFDWNDGTPIWLASPIYEHIYNSTGTYNTQCRAQNSQGFWSSMFTGPVITPQTQAPIAKLHIIPQVADINEDIILNGSESYDQDLAGYITKYEFDPGTGTFDIDNGINPNVPVQFSEYGTYTIRLRVSDNDTPTPQTAITQATVKIAGPFRRILYLNYMPRTGNRLKNLLYDEDTRTFMEGIETERTASNGLTMEIGAKCQGDLGAQDILRLEKIRDSDPEPQEVQLTIDGKTYIGVLTNIKIEKLPGAGANSWIWTASLEISTEPQGARYE